MEKKERNIELTQSYINGVSPSELIVKYKISRANVNRIVAETKAKYPELLQFNN